jgi:hypothetical protein
MDTKNKLRIGFSTLAIAAFMTIGTSSVEAFDPDCSTGSPHVDCPIWNLKVGAGEFSCTTGGEWKCEDPTQQ